MKAQTALIGTKGRIVLDAIPSIDLYTPLVISPGHPEHDLPLRLDNTLKDAAPLILGLLLEQRFKRLQNLTERLNELRLMRIALFHAADDFLNIRRGHGEAPSANRRKKCYIFGNRRKHMLMSTCPSRICYVPLSYSFGKQHAGRSLLAGLCGIRYYFTKLLISCLLLISTGRLHSEQTRFL